METEIKVSTKNLENAKNIKLSTNTHKLIMCRAMLNDIEETVVNIVGDIYGASQEDEILKDFRTRQSNLDLEISTLLSDVIDDTLHNGDFDTGAFKEM